MSNTSTDHPHQTIANPRGALTPEQKSAKIRSGGSWNTAPDLAEPGVSDSCAGSSLDSSSSDRPEARHRHLLPHFLPHLRGTALSCALPGDHADLPLSTTLPCSLAGRRPLQKCGGCRLACRPSSCRICARSGTCHRRGTYLCRSQCRSSSHRNSRSCYQTRPPATSEGPPRREIPLAYP